MHRVAIGLVLVSLACGVPAANAGDDVGSSSEEMQASPEDRLPPSWTACASDADCVVAPGCCPGTQVAVNRRKLGVHQAARCRTAHPRCTAPVRSPEAVPECSHVNGRCELVRIGDIHCGGFIRNPHRCPPGYFCEFSGVPDAGGACVTQCGHNYICPPVEHWDEAACRCVGNPACGPHLGCDSDYRACEAGICVR